MYYHQINSLSQSHKFNIWNLWNREYPTTIRHQTVEELEEYLATLLLQEHIIIEDNAKNVKGWCCVFQRNNETWFAMILDSSIQGQGYGSELLRKIKEKHSILNGWIIVSSEYKKQSGEAYISPKAFYQKNGFRIHHSIKLETVALKTIKISWKK